MKKLCSRFLFGVCLLLISTISYAQVTANPEAWREDLRYFASELPRRHANFYNSISPDEFAQAVDALNATIPFKSDGEIQSGFLRLAAMAKDAHTSVAFSTNNSIPFLRRFPIRVRWFKDGLYLITVSYLSETSGRGGRYNYQRLLGGRLVKVGEMPIEQVIQRLSQNISYENEYWLHAQLPNFVITPEILKDARVIEEMERIPLTFEFANGSQFTITPPIVFWSESVPWREAVIRKELPLYRQNTSTNYWYKFLDDSRTLWMQYNRCRDIPENPMTNFANEIFAVADANSATHFVIDLRNNTGGNSEIIRPVINGLVQRPWLNQRGKVYVIIGNTTISSGLWGAIYFRNLTNAILLGEPTGGKPNSYGEVLSSILPNSKIIFQFSTKFQRIIPDDPVALFPDVPIEISAAEYNNNDDPVFSYILSQ